MLARVSCLRAARICLAAAATMSCDGNVVLPQRSPSPSSVLPNPGPSPLPAVPTYTVSGVVVEHMRNHSEVRSGVRLRVSTSAGVSEAISEQAGSYQIVVPAGPVIVTAAIGFGYRAPCPPSDDVVNTDRVFNVNILSEALLIDGGGSWWLWWPLPPGKVTFGGKVFERTSSGIEPIAGASIEMTNGERSYSSTMSSGAGGYALCSPPPHFNGPTSLLDWNMHITRDGFKPARVNLGDIWDIEDVELVRQ